MKTTTRQPLKREMTTNLTNDDMKNAMIDEIINNLYLDIVWCKDVDPSFWVKDPKNQYSSDGLKDKILAAYKRIMRSTSNDDINWKVRCADRTTYFILEPYELDSNEKYPWADILVLDFVDECEYSGLMVTKFKIMPDTNSVEIDKDVSQYITTKLHTNLTANEKSERYNQKYDPVSFLCKSLQYLRDFGIMDDAKTEIPNHTRIEMDIFRESLHLEYSRRNMKYAQKYITVFGGESSAEIGCMIDEVFNEGAVNDDIVTKYDKPAPILSLSSRDWKFIHKYVSENMLMDLAQPINLLDLADGQPYGCRVFDSYTTKSGYNFMIYQELEVSQIHGFARIIMLAKIEKFGYLEITYNFNNANNCVIQDDLIDIAACLLIRVDNTNNIPTGIDDISEWCPIPLTVGILSSMFIQFLSLLVILKNRPTLYRVITESIKDSNETKADNKHKHESCVVTRRILKTAYAAKNYIREMSENKSDREYTMERWTRREHDRHLKSGKVVHIGAQKCTRHLPIAQKEIHIKL